MAMGTCKYTLTTNIEVCFIDYFSTITCESKGPLIFEYLMCDATNVKLLLPTTFPTSITDIYTVVTTPFTWDNNTMLTKFTPKATAT